MNHPKLPECTQASLLDDVLAGGTSGIVKRCPLFPSQIGFASFIEFVPQVFHIPDDQARILLRIALIVQYGLKVECIPAL